MIYVFDTNTLLEAKNRYYSFNVCPAFWDWLLQERKRGQVLSIEAVRDELEDPDARSWCASNDSFFEGNDVSRLADVSNWVNASTQYRPDAKSSFLAKADPVLIAHALSKKYTVVTQEASAPDAKKRVKVPDVCNAFSVSHKNTFEVLEELKARFILETS